MSHRRAGWVFVSGMTIVSITALLLAGTRWATDPTPRGREAGAFLFFISILTATSVSGGVRVLRAKTRTTRHRHPWDLGLPALLTASSIAGAAYGLSTGNHLFTAFLGHRLVRRRRPACLLDAPPTHPMHWWFEHMSSMLGACIAATTAFRGQCEPPGAPDVLAGGVAGAIGHRRAGDRDLDSLLPEQVRASGAECRSGESLALVRKRTNGTQDLVRCEGAAVRRCEGSGQGAVFRASCHPCSSI